MFPLILLSIALGILGGVFFPHEMLAMSWVGQLFINLLKLIVLPLIFCAMVSAITSIGGMHRLGSIGVYTLGYVLVSVSIAVTIGLCLLNMFKPGVGIAPSLIMANASPLDLKPMPFSAYMLELFPPNIVAAAARYEIMPIVFFIGNSRGGSLDTTFVNAKFAGYVLFYFNFFAGVGVTNSLASIGRGGGREKKSESIYVSRKQCVDYSLCHVKLNGHLAHYHAGRKRTGSE